MPKIAVEVERLGKNYLVNELRHRRSLSERLGNLIAAPLRRPALPREEVPTDIWALRDVSFAVEEGRILGVIGHNGSGKSTLLRILARITMPSEGRAVLHGRVGVLLEVGTGFHPDLSGRENIYLNGTMIGMARAEIQRHEDEIIEFADVRQLIDTPVKHYSSGMFTRLAFAVAAHLDAEIMLIDEVLAVGDEAFQEKCKAKIRDIAKSGRTVLFTSHDMAAIKRLCYASVVLDHGRLAYYGDTAEAIKSYRRLSNLSEQGAEEQVPGKMTA